MKSKEFSKELSYIKNDNIKKSAEIMLELLPDYFYEVPASSTGKYHPKYTTGDKGLVRHTKAAVRIAFELLNNPSIGDKYSDTEKDIMIMGLLLHDGLKSGLEKSTYTLVDHPILVANYIKDNKDKLMLNDDEVILLTDSIKTHMGPWNKDYRGNEVLEKPKTKHQNFVHMCDYLASRKFLLVDFDDNNIIID